MFPNLLQYSTTDVNVIVDVGFVGSPGHEDQYPPVLIVSVI